MLKCCFSQERDRDDIPPLAEFDETPPLTLLDIDSFRHTMWRLAIVYNMFTKLRTIINFHHNFTYCPLRLKILTKRERIRKEVEVLASLQSKVLTSIQSRASCATPP